MKILILTSRPPFPVSGDRVRVRQQIAWLARDHEVSVLTLVGSAEERAQAERLRAGGVRIEAVPRSAVHGAVGLVQSIVTGQPLQTGYFECAGMHARVRETIAAERPDVVYAHLARMGRYWRRGATYAQVLDLCDALSLQYAERGELRGVHPSAVLDRVESRRLRAWERASLRRYDAVSIISNADAAAVDQASPPAVVPLHVQDYLDYERPSAPHDDHPEILFPGEMSTYYSSSAARFLVNEVMPRVWAHVPSASVKIVGANPSKEIAMLRGPRVEVTGYVDDLRPWFTRATAVACPIRMGTGLKTKVLQAMAVGTPVVASPAANRGIAATDGTHLLLADEPQAFAERLIALLTKAELRTQLSDRARRFVQERFSERAMGTRLNLLLETGLANAAVRLGRHLPEAESPQPLHQP